MGKKLLFVLLVFVLEFEALKSQEMYPVRGTVYIREGKASKISLLVTSENTKEHIPVDINGDFATKLAWDENFIFYFSKPGYISKRVSFATQIPKEVSKNMIYPYQILVELFPTFPNADTVFFLNPVAKIKYSKQNNDFDYDLDYQLIVKDKIDKVKKQYSLWQKKPTNKAKPAKETISKAEELSVLHYQKSVEVEKKNVALNSKSKHTQIKEYRNVKNNDPFGLPPLKDTYTEGKSIEIHELKGKVITRVIMKNGNYQKSFYKVRHNWGGLYYFVQESPSNFRSISKYNFEKATKI